MTSFKDYKERFNRTREFYRILSNINRMIIRVNNEEDLFAEACKIIVDFGNYPLAWIGLLDEKNEEVKPIAAYGHKEFLDDLYFSINSNLPEGLGPVGTAIRERKVVVASIADPLPEPWLEAYRQYGFRSSLTLPIEAEGQVIGALSVYTADMSFSKEEIKLLEEVAGDISFTVDHLRKRKRVEFLTLYDELTELPNKKYFMTEVAEKIKEAKRERGKIAIILMDIDDFTAFNDTFGYTQGDKILKYFASSLLSFFSDKEFVSRVGSDEFGVITSFTTEAEMVRLVEELKAIFSTPVKLNGEEISFTFCLGISIYPNDAKEPEELLNCAERALIRARKAGKNNYRFCSKMLERQFLEIVTLTSELKEAIKKKQFALFYHPQVDLLTRKISGAEALIRWFHPKEGLTLPGEFIFLLEETGMINEVGDWVLEETCRQIKEWENKGLDLNISANLSLLQLKKDDFYDKLSSIVQKADINPAHLTIEITESLFMEDVEENIKKLQKIRDEGICISLDDFGTGYSSMSYLKKLPISSLKIDISFIRGLPDNREDAAIVKAIVALAESLGLKTVAEGIETKEQLAVLTGIGCETAQGYYFSKPLPPAEFENFLSAYTPQQFFW